ncbi:MAG: heme ABC exporter ATP-binding protein CcmA [Terriglobia bacterium]
MPPDAAATEPVLETRGLAKYFGETPALKGVTLRISRGESVLIYGPNGAGKTTLLRTLALLCEPSEGELLLAGARIGRNPPSAKAKFGFVSHATYLYGDLSARENLRFAGDLFGLSRLESRIAELLDQFGLRQRAAERVRNLSRGFQQRVTLARALLHDPEILLLDEPFTGLDAQSAAGLEALLRTLAHQGKAVVFSTHSFAQGAAIASRCVLLERGRVRYDGPVDRAPVSSREPSGIAILEQQAAEKPAELSS